MFMDKPKEVEKSISTKRDAKDLDDLVKSSPVPKVKPRAEQKKDIKDIDEKVVLVKAVVKECMDALREYSVIKLVEQAKITTFREMKKSDKELLCAGLIKLGEALTFCRDRGNETLRKIGIIDIAINCAKARNQFVHHQLYHSRLDRYIETQECINRLYAINKLEEQLSKLEQSSLKQLSKPNGKPENDFPFEYSHFVICLKAEVTELKDILAISDVNTKITSDTVLRATLENRIRNILAIMIDLTDENRVNKNKGNFCTDQKEAAKEINKIFAGEFPQFFMFFRDLKIYRNSLCHLDDSLRKPYNDFKEMFEFAKKLLDLERLGYVNRLEKQFLQEQKKKLEKEETHSKTGLISSAPLKQETEQVAETKKETQMEQKKEVGIQKNISEGLQSILQYNSDEEEKQEPPNTGAPRMGGHS